MNFRPIHDHVLLPLASALAEADQRLAPRLTPALVEGIVQQIPDAWLDGDAPFDSREHQRQAYLEHFIARLQTPRAFALEAQRAHASL